MKTIRQDAWTDEDDRVLAEIILRHIAQGSTQLAAFEESSEKLGRTSAACGYRWNANVRKAYKTGIDIAKSQRKQARSQEKKSLLEGSLLQHLDPESAAGITWNEVFRFLKMCRHDEVHAAHQLKKMEKELAAKEKEMNSILSENRVLKLELQRVTEEYEQVKADYRTMVSIFEKARKLTLFNPESTQEFAHTRFRMDANGNLEKIE